MRKVPFTPARFGRLQALGVAPSGKRSRSRWLCLCDCGKFVTPYANNLLRGKSKSCGCTRLEGTTLRHGHSRNGHWSREYRAWVSMKTRVHNPRRKEFKNYGARGITICRKWLQSFEAFFRDMGKCPEGMSLERIDNDGSYVPGNCRWATQQEQMQNTRNTRLIRYHGVLLSMAELARRSAIKYSCLRWRLDAGWEIERAVTMPSRGK